MVEPRTYEVSWWHELFDEIKLRKRDKRDILYVFGVKDTYDPLWRAMANRVNDIERDHPTIPIPVIVDMLTEEGLIPGL